MADTILRDIVKADADIKAHAKRTKLQQLELEVKLEKMRLTIMDRMKLKAGDEVKLHIIEYRDDTVFCLAAEQWATCFITDVTIMKRYYDDNSAEDELEPFIAPVLHTKDRIGQLKKKPISNNWYCSWELYGKNDKLLMFHRPKSVIIEGKYTPEELEARRARCLEIQRIK